MNATAAAPNTPGIAGYVLASLIAFGLAGSLTYVLTAFAAMESDEGGTVVTALLAAVIYLLPLAIAFGVLGLPVAFVGVVLVHLALRKVGRQAAHVVAAGVVAVALVSPYVLLLDLDEVGPSLPVIVASCGLGSAAGRACVIPLVNSRRRLAAEGRLTGTARW